MSNPRAIALATYAVLWNDDVQTLSCLHMVARQDEFCCPVPQALAEDRSLYCAEELGVELLLHFVLHFSPSFFCMFLFKGYAVVADPRQIIVLLPVGECLAVPDTEMYAVAVPLVGVVVIDFPETGIDRSFAVLEQGTVERCDQESQFVAQRNFHDVFSCMERVAVNQSAR